MTPAPSSTGHTLMACAAMVKGLDERHAGIGSANGVGGKPSVADINGENTLHDKQRARARMEAPQTDTFRALAEGRLPDGVSGQALPRLRFDRTAQRCVQGLQAELSDDVREGLAVIVTIAAPIRLPARAVNAVSARIRDLLSRNGSGTFDETICGNRVRMKIVLGVSMEAPKVIVFVCNPNPPPDDLLELADVLLASGR